MEVTYKVTVDVDTNNKTKAKNLANEYIQDVLESGVDMANKLECECDVCYQSLGFPTVQSKVKDIIKAWKEDEEEEEQYGGLVSELLDDFMADGLTIPEAFKVYMTVKNKLEKCRYFQKYPDEGLFEFNFKEKDGWFDGETDIKNAKVIATY